MKRQLKKSLSLLLVLLIFFPNIILASSRIHIDTLVDEDQIKISIRGEKESPLSITVADENRYYYIDQSRTDKLGKADFTLSLEEGKSYKILVNIAGQVEEKILKIDQKEEPLPDKEDKVSLSIQGYKGSILNKSNIGIREGENLLDLTLRILEENNIVYSNDKGYISSIDGLSEFDRGKDSGWMFSVNGHYPKLAAGKIILKDGDIIEWNYTYNLGEDLGAGSVLEEKDKSLKESINIIKSGQVKDKDLLEELENIGEKFSKEIKSKDQGLRLLNDLVAALDRPEIKGKNRETREELAQLILQINDKYQEFFLGQVTSEEILPVRNINRRTLGLVLALDNNLSQELIDRSNTFNHNLYKLNPSQRKYKPRLELALSGQGNKLGRDFILKGIEKSIENILIEQDGLELEFKLESLKDIEGDLQIRTDGEKLKAQVLCQGEALNLKNPVLVRLPYKHLGKDQLIVKTENHSLACLYDYENNFLIFRTRELGNFKIVENPLSFKDLDQAPWARDSIEKLAAKGLIKGPGGDKFNPKSSITRAEFITLINRTMGLEDLSEDLNFKDISKGDWYYKEIQTAYNLGLIKGKSPNVFDPKGYISREEIASIVGKVLKENSFKNSMDSLETYKDGEKISAWALEGFSYLIHNGILQGDNNMNLNPRQNASRAEAALLIERLYKLTLFK